MTGNRKFFYFYDMNQQKIHKINQILGHESEKDLRRLAGGKKFYFAIASSVTGIIFVMS